MIPFFILFVVATFEVAKRLTPPLIAGLLTVTLVVWTVPNYPAAIPSWFNLYFAVVGVWMIAKWLETRSDLWLFIAGFSGGASRSSSRSSASTSSSAWFFFSRSEGFERNPQVQPNHRAERRSGGALLPLLRSFRSGSRAADDGASAWLGGVRYLRRASHRRGGCAHRRSRPWKPTPDVAAIRAGAIFIAGVAVPVVLFAVPYLVTG